MAFHWIMTLFAVVMSLGGIVDARQHIQHGFEIESFFVASHYLLYAGWILGGAALVIQILRRRRAGKSLHEWLPKGYFLSLLGFLVFGLGGGVDMTWHEIYGFETNLEAPVSPGHTLLVLGAGLMYAAVIFHGAYLQKQSPHRFAASLNRLNLPTILSTIAFLTALLWPTWFLDPFLVDFPSGGVTASHVYAYGIFDFGNDTANAVALAGVFLMTLLTMPAILLPLHRWRMPPGTTTLIVAGYTALRATVGNAYIYLPAAIGAALVGDLIWGWARAGGEQRLSSSTPYRLIAFAVPFAQYGLYFTMIAVFLKAQTWSVYLWTGAVFTTAVFSLLMSYLLIKPTNSGVDALLYRFRILEDA